MPPSSDGEVQGWGLLNDRRRDINDNFFSRFFCYFIVFYFNSNFVSSLKIENVFQF